MLRGAGSSRKMRDGKFPRSRQTGGKPLGSSSEINEWIENRPVRRLKGN